MRQGRGFGPRPGCVHSGQHIHVSLPQINKHTHTQVNSTAVRNESGSRLAALAPVPASGTHPSPQGTLGLRILLPGQAAERTVLCAAINTSLCGEDTEAQEVELFERQVGRAEVVTSS